MLDLYKLIVFSKTPWMITYNKPFTFVESLRQTLFISIVDVIIHTGSSLIILSINRWLPVKLKFLLQNKQNKKIKNYMIKF